MTGGMMFKGTPGPWLTGDFLGDFNTEWSADLDSYPKNGVSTSQPIVHNGKTIALVVWEGWDDKKGEATAYAMAAAPELLEALINIIPAAETGSERSSPVGYFDHRIEAARAAIAKALGEQK